MNLLCFQCKNFSRAGRCAYGIRCRFIHSWEKVKSFVPRKQLKSICTYAFHRLWILGPWAQSLQPIIHWFLISITTNQPGVHAPRFCIQLVGCDARAPVNVVLQPNLSSECVLPLFMPALCEFYEKLFWRITSFKTIQPQPLTTQVLFSVLLNVIIIVSRNISELMI